MKYTLTQFLLWEFIPSGSKMQTAFPYDAAIWGKERKKKLKTQNVRLGGNWSKCSLVFQIS